VRPGLYFFTCPVEIFTRFSSGFALLPKARFLFMISAKNTKLRNLLKKFNLVVLNRRITKLETQVKQLRIKMLKAKIRN